ncbi:MAG: hypothetical protein HUK12_03860 [Muribaculaceae bacterium]|nr:hypothetical protein [Muribaculaceae bacterium]
MDDNVLAAKHARQLESFDRRYAEQFEALAKSNSYKGGLDDNARFVLGSNLDAYKRYESDLVAGGSSAASLGKLPSIAVDLISATYGLTVAPQLASMQTIDECQGIIYFKKVFTHGYPFTATEGLRALPNDGWMDEDGNEPGSKFNGMWKTWHDHRGAPTGSEGASSGGTLPSEDISAKNFDAITFSALKGWVSSPTAYMSERQYAKVVDGTVTLANVIGNTRWNVPMDVRLVNEDGDFVDLKGVCDGPGQLPVFYGNNITTEVVPQGNDLVLIFDGKINGKDIIGGAVAYDVDFEKAPDVPAIESATTSTFVTAHIFGVKELQGDFKSYQFQKRFGKSAEDDMVADLSGHLAMAESEKVIGALKKAANANGKPLTWNINCPVGIAEAQHRKSLLFTISAGSSLIGTRTGRGRINKIVAGYAACEYIASLDGFRQAPAQNGIGPHVFGTLENEGITVIRSNTVVAPNEILGCYINPNSPYEAAVVDATYMPAFLTDTLKVANNPFQNMRAIATWKAIETVVPQFVVRIVLTKGLMTPPDFTVAFTNAAGGNSSAGSQG